MKKKLWLFVMFFSLITRAENIKINGIWFAVLNGESSVEVAEPDDGVKYKGDIIIPSYINYNGITYPVTRIGPYAFDGCNELTSISIPGSINYIGDNAFQNCKELISVQIEDLTSWCNISFNGSSSQPLSYAHHLFLNGVEIKDLVIPNNVTSINSMTFYGCRGLSSLTIPSTVTSIGGFAFSGCSGLRTVSIPSSIKSIEVYTFNGCSSLSSIIIPNSVTKIDYGAFAGCKSLTALSIPQSVITIGNSAFSGCCSLNSIVVESGNRFYDSRDNCNAIIKTSTNSLLTGCNTTTIPNSVTSLGYNAFSGCVFESIEIPSSIKEIGQYAFENCKNLSSIIIPSSVTSIDNGTFSHCSSLKSIELPNSITSIGNDAFMGSGLNSIIIPKRVWSIGESAFAYCDNLTTANIRGDLGDYAFHDCSNLTSISINTGSIGENAFMNCNKLKTIEFHGYSIGAWFSGFLSIEKIIIGDDVEYAEERAFEYCSNLECVVIGRSFKGVGYGAFNGCNKLKNVEFNCISIGSWFCNLPIENITIGNEVVSIGYMAFSGCNNLSFFTIPNNIIEIGNYAFQNCSNLTSLDIPSSVNKISPNAFNGCTGLSSIIVDSNNTTYDSRDNCNAIIETNTNTLVSGCEKTIIPNTVTTIGSSAFYGHSELSGIDIPGSVCAIGNQSFCNCTGLLSITIPDNVTSIGNYAFYNCIGINTIRLGNNVSEIGDYAFSKITNIVDMFCYANNLPNVGKNIFENTYTNRATLHVPESSLAIYTTTEPWNKFKTIVALPKNTYTLTYYIDDEIYKTYELAPNTFISPEPAPTKDGYTFSGWSEIPETMPDHDVIVTGSFTVNSYTLLYMVDGEEYKTASITYGTAITPEEAPTKEGYTFSGWSEIPETMPSQDVTVTGTFTINQYTIYFDTDGGSFVECITQDYSSAIIPPADPIKVGYTFIGWEPEIPETMPAGDLTCVAQWQVNSYALTYIVDGQEYKVDSIAYGMEITPEPVPTKEGYTFSGWSYIPGTMPATDVVVMGTFSINSYALTYVVDGEEYKTSTVVYGSEITPEAEPTKEGYTFSGWSEIPENMPAGDVVVTGSFIPNSYTLSYMVDGEEYKTASVTYGTAISPEAEPTKEGYTFSGWSEIPNTMPAEDVTVTGSFTINQYLLTYILEGEEYKSYEIDFNTALTPEPAPTKKGMTFSGWGDVPETMPAHDVTLTGSYTWSKEIVDDVVYQVADTLSNYASVVGYEGTGEEVTILSDVLIGEDVYAVNNIAENALPKTTTIYVSVGRLLLWLWTNGYEDIRDTDSGRCLPAPEISLEGKTASSLSLSYKNDYPQFSETITLQGSPVEKGKKGYDLALTGLEPDKLYEGLATLTLTYEEAFYSKSFSFKTEPLTLTTQQPKIISLGNVIVAATSNLDDAEMNVGFEWRRTDWTDDFASNFGKAYLYKGTMEGYIRNLYIEKLWKYRPYYESNDGNRYYGNWVGIDPTNTSYFMPTVHTYSRIDLTGNLAKIWGYVMRGTDNITMQGFIYWSISSTSSSRRNANGIPSDATKVLATGNVMSATLEDLDYDTEYCYMAFVTTSEGETFYGEPQTFKTSFDPDGIENVMASEEVTEVARYDIQGRMISKPQKGINIIRFSDGTTKKVIVKQ